MTRARYIVPLLGLLACGHDTSRENPLDPKLTPAVELQATLDDTAGTVSLAWSPYQGEPPFAAYLVLRNAVRSTEVDTLARLSERDAATFVDSLPTPDIGYEYRVVVVNEAGLERASNVQRLEGFSTRPVVLRDPEADPVTGSLTVTWSRYRDPGFVRYRVFRRQLGTDADSVIATASGVRDTVFVDSTARHGVDYAYRTVVSAAGGELSSGIVEGRLELPAVSIEALELESTTAAAQLTWTRYTVPRFASYEVRRSTPTTTAQTIATHDDPDAASLTDSELRGDTEYTYHVVAVTTRGEEVSSTGASGGLHRRADSWPILHAHLDGDLNIRLYPEAAGVSALVSPVSRPDGLSREAHRTYLHRFARDGQLLGRNLVLDHRVPEFVHTQTATVLAPWERRYVSTGANDLARAVTVLTSNDPGGRYETALFRISSPVPYTGSLAGSNPQIVLRSPTAYRDLRVISSGVPLFEEDFSEFPIGADYRNTLQAGRWVGTGGGSELTGGWLELVEIRAPSMLRTTAQLLADDLAVEVDVQLGSERSVRHRLIGVTIDDVEIELLILGGGDLGSTADALQAVLKWTDTETMASDSSVAPVSVAPEIPFRLRLTIGAGKADVELEVPVATTIAVEPTWTSLAPTGSSVLLTVADQAFHLSADGELTSSGTFAGLVSELRTWPNQRGAGVGVCLPLQNRVLVGLAVTSRQTTWPEGLSGVLGRSPSTTTASSTSPTHSTVGSRCSRLSRARSAHSSPPNAGAASGRQIRSVGIPSWSTACQVLSIAARRPMS